MDALTTDADFSPNAPSPGARSTVSSTPDEAASQSPQDSSKPATQKTTKRRAARACSNCRSRKVRCNVVDRMPCTTCEYDGVKCFVQESRRRKKNMLPPHLSAVVPNGVPPQGIAGHAGHMPAGLPGTGMGHCGPQQSYRAHPLFPQPLAPLSIPNSLREPPAQFQFGGIPIPGAWSNAAAPAATPPLEKPMVQLPGFIRPIPDRIPAEDIAYLQSKGALTIPDEPLRNALLQSYVEYVYPFLPAVDLHRFLESMSENNGSISLFLFQAIMFAGAAFVSPELLQQGGLGSRREARKTLFFRARKLYDLDLETNKITVIQALLLMTYWYETPDDQKDTWHWMGIAVSLARTVGLNHDPNRNSMLSESRRHMWKRLWWSCFVRDRLIALGVRRPPRIDNQDFDVPMLVEDDFCFRPLPDGNLSPQCVFAHSIGMQRQLALMCIEQAKLTVVISHLLQTQYRVLSPGDTGGQPANSPYMMLPKKTLGNWDDVLRVDAELREWKDSLPESCIYRETEGEDVANGLEPVTLHRSLLNMLYHAAVSALFRPHFSVGHDTTKAREIEAFARSRLKASSRATVHIAGRLLQHNMVRRLPTVGVTVTMPATLIHLLELPTAHKTPDKTALECFQVCMMVLNQLRDAYPVADYATRVIAMMLQRFGIKIPNLDQSGGPLFNGPPTGPAMGEPAMTPPPEYPPFAAKRQTDMSLSALTLGGQGGIQHSPPASDDDSCGDASDHSEALASHDFGMDARVYEDNNTMDWQTTGNQNFDITDFVDFGYEGAGEVQGMLEQIEPSYEPCLESIPEEAGDWMNMLKEPTSV